MKTKKEKTLEAHEKLITKYKKALIKLDRLRSTKILNDNIDCTSLGIYLNMDDCPLYLIHYKLHLCRGCPLANKYGRPGCIQFNSIIELNRAKGAIELRVALKKRILFHETALISLKFKPKRFFTRSGWKYFVEDILRVNQTFKKVDIDYLDYRSYSDYTVYSTGWDNKAIAFVSKQIISFDMVELRKGKGRDLKPCIKYIDFIISDKEGEGSRLLDFIINDIFSSEPAAQAIGADIRITNYKSIILFVKKGFKVYNVKNDYYSDITNAIMKGESKPIKLQEKAIHQPSIISKLREKRLKVILEKKII